MERIESTQNERFMALRRLATEPRTRRALGQCWLEGLRLVEAALSQAVLYSSGPHRAVELVLSASVAAAPSDRAARLMSEAHTLSVPMLVLADTLFAKVSQVVQEQGIGLVWATAETEATDVARLDAMAGDGMVLDGVQDPGNVGALLRVAAAAGLGWMVSTKGTAEVWSPKALRASMGGVFGLRVIEGASAEDALTVVSGIGATPLATVAPLGDELGDGHSPKHTESLFSQEGRLSQPAPVAWVFGQEGSGISASLMQWPGLMRLTIPQAAAVESLNVVAAAAVCLFERRRRLLSGQGPVC
jgi:TrmH family RNA methyltransferase